MQEKKLKLMTISWGALCHILKIKECDRHELLSDGP